MKREQRKTPLHGPLARLRRGFCRKSPPSDRRYARVRTPDLYGPVVAEERTYIPGIYQKRGFSFVLYHVADKVH